MSAFGLRIKRKGRLLRKKWVIKNTATIDGTEELAQRGWGTPTIASSQWYGGLIASGGVSPADTMGSHAWTEFTDYSTLFLSRPQMVMGSIVPSLDVHAGFEVEFEEISILADGQINGLFIVDESTIGGTTGFLWSTATKPLGGPGPLGFPINVLEFDSVLMKYFVGADL